MNYKRFAIVYVAASILFAVLSYILEAFAGVSTGYGAVAIPIVAAMDAGQQFAKTKGRAPQSGPAWKASFQMTLIEAAISMIVLLGLIALFGSALLPDIQRDQVSTIISIMVIFTLILFAWSFLVKRWAYGFGAKSALKAQQKTAAKGGA